MSEFAQIKARIRHAKGLMRRCRQAVNSGERSEIRLSADDYEALEWCMAHLVKGWVYDFDADGEPIPDTARYVRLNCLFRATTERAEAFAFKGIPVVRA